MSSGQHHANENVELTDRLEIAAELLAEAITAALDAGSTTYSISKVVNAVLEGAVKPTLAHANARAVLHVVRR